MCVLGNVYIDTPLQMRVAAVSKSFPLQVDTPPPEEDESVHTSHPARPEWLPIETEHFQPSILEV